jgi:hypothetical protein
MATETKYIKSFRYENEVVGRWTYAIVVTQVEGAGDGTIYAQLGPGPLAPSLEINPVLPGTGTWEGANLPGVIQSFQNEAAAAFVIATREAYSAKYNPRADLQSLGYVNSNER